MRVGLQERPAVGRYFSVLGLFAPKSARAAEPPTRTPSPTHDVDDEDQDGNGRHDPESVDQQQGQGHARPIEQEQGAAGGEQKQRAAGD